MHASTAYHLAYYLAQMVSQVVKCMQPFMRVGGICRFSLAAWVLLWQAWHDCHALLEVL